MDATIVIAFSVLTSIAILILISIGLAILFGLMGVINMAHGEFLMIGAFAAVTANLRLAVPLWVGIIIAPIITGLIGLLVERTLIRPLYGGRIIDSLLVTFGLSLVIYQLAVDIFGTTSPGIGTPFGNFQVGRFTVLVYSGIILPVAALGLIVVLYALYEHTRYGLLARAVAQNPEMAAALGVNATRINAITFTVGCGAAGLGGALVAPLVSVNPAMGQSYVAQAFLTVVVGGPAFLLGTSVASGALGFLQTLATQLGSALWGIVVLMGAAIILIRAKPRGLSGTWRRQI